MSYSIQTTILLIAFLTLEFPGFLAPQSGAHTIAPHRDPNPIHTHTHTHPLIALEQEDPEKTHDVIYF